MCVCDAFPHLVPVCASPPPPHHLSLLRCHSCASPLLRSDAPHLIPLHLCVCLYVNVDAQVYRRQAATRLAALEEAAVGRTTSYEREILHLQRLLRERQEAEEKLLQSKR